VSGNNPLLTSGEGFAVTTPDDSPRRFDSTTRVVRRRRRTWLLVGCGVLTFLLLPCAGLVGTGLYYAGAFGPRWQAFDVPGGGCRVDVPATPVLDPAPAQPGVVNLTAYSARRRIPDQEFGVGYFDIPARDPGPQDLDAGLSGMVKTLSGLTERTRGPATLDGLPGRQVIGDGPRGTLVARLVSVGNRIYVLMAYGRGIDPNAPEVAHFFGSFQVTDQARLAQAAAKQRQAEDGVAARDKWIADQKAAREKAQQEFLAKKEAARQEYEQFEKTGRRDREPPDGSKLPGVKMYLPFGPDGGTEVRNAIGGRVYGTFKEPAKFGVGVRGTALHLPGDYAAVYLPDTDAVQFGPDDPFTFAAWFRSRNGSEYGTVTVLAVGTGGGIGTMDQLRVELGQGKVRAALWAPKLDPRNLFPTPAPVMSAPWDGDDGWHHFAVVRTPRDAGEVVQFYFDGRRVAEQMRDRRTDLYAAKALTLGGGVAGHGTNFRGGIDEVYAFSRALSGAEVRRLAALAVPSTSTPVVRSAAGLPGLIFHLPFDDADSEQMTESVTAKPVGRVGGTVDAIDGVRGSAARLTGARAGDRRVALDLTDQRGKFRFAEGAPFTLATWIRVPAERAVLLGGPPLRVSVSGTSVTAFLGYPDGPEVRAFRPPRDRWFHLALVREPGGKVRLFVDGVAATLGPDPVWPAEVAPAAIGLGAEVGDAEVDEFCLFDRALTADEVVQLATRLAGVTTGPATALPLAAAPPPSPADFPGLVFHLPLDDTDGDRVADAVGRKAVGRIRSTAEVVDGVRGRAIRLGLGSRAPLTEVNATLLNLDDQAGKLKLGSKDPFTIAVWVRGGREGCFVWARSPRPVKGYNNDDRIELFLHWKLVSAQLRGTDSNPPGLTGERADPDEWVHVAMTRDPDATLRLYLNGAAVPQKKDPVVPIALNPTELGLMIQRGQGVTCDFDEFCVYNRALSADELKKLGTRPAGEKSSGPGKSK
jgi:hypothetical protein